MSHIIKGKIKPEHSSNGIYNYYVALYLSDREINLLKTISHYHSAIADMCFREERKFLDGNNLLKYLNTCLKNTCSVSHTEESTCKHEWALNNLFVDDSVFRSIPYDMHVLNLCRICNVCGRMEYYTKSHTWKFMNKSVFNQ
jgi:hypothetical protein